MYHTLAPADIQYVDTILCGSVDSEGELQVTSVVTRWRDYHSPSGEIITGPLIPLYSDVTAASKDHSDAGVS